MTKLIVIEGPDQCGKQTQSELLHHHLLTCGYNVKLIEVPTNDRVFYPIIYWMLDNGLAKKYPTVFQLVHFFNKLLFALILPLYCWKYSYIIFDRWKLSGFVYGKATGSKSILTALFKILPEMDYTIVLHGQKFSRNCEDSFEKDNELQAKVRELYKTVAEENGYKIINCNQPKEVIHSTVVEYIKCDKWTKLIDLYRKNR